PPTGPVDAVGSLVPDVVEHVARHRDPDRGHGRERQDVGRSHRAEGDPASGENAGRGEQQVVDADEAQQISHAARPRTAARSAARPNDSVSEGSRNRSLPRRISATLSTLPRKRTSRRSSRRSTSCSAASRSGPSPTSTSVAGSSRRTPANTRTTSVTRLTGRKFETWTRILWSGGASERRQVPPPGG